MKKYDFVSYLSPDQARLEIIQLGNDTGAEVNNYALRMAIGHLKNDMEFPLLSQLEKYLSGKYRKQAERYLGDSIACGKYTVFVIRDRLNMGRALEANFSGEKKFTGDCMRHGTCSFNVYGSQSINYKCCLCIQEKMDNNIQPVPIIYNLDRNVLLADFLLRNDLDKKTFSHKSGVMLGPLERYLNCEETITASHWRQIKSQIRRYLKTGKFSISKGLEFNTIFVELFKKLECEK